MYPLLLSAYFLVAGALPEPEAHESQAGWKPVSPGKLLSCSISHLMLQVFVGTLAVILELGSEIRNS